jgi:hypothetical protein
LSRPTGKSEPLMPSNPMIDERAGAAEKPIFKKREPDGERNLIAVSEPELIV